MKSVRAVLILEALNELTEVIATDPDEETIEKDDFDGKFSVYIKGDRDKVYEALRRIAEIESFDVVEISSKVTSEDTKEKFTEKLKKTESIRVNIKQLDTIMNLVGELVICKGRLLQIAQEYDIPELREAVSIMDKSIISLQDEIMRIRMVKIERIFNKFPRMVRDLARKLGKKVELIIEGHHFS